MIDGCLHLSVESGCGGTTFALQVARDVLIRNAHVIWVCSEIPDGNRMSQIFMDVSPASVSKLHVAAVGENIASGISSAIGLMNSLDSLGLIVVDDWAPKTGKTPAESTSKVNELIERTGLRNVPLLLISSAYEDASGKSGWLARGSLKCNTWFLHNNTQALSLRDLIMNDESQHYRLTDDGFIPHK